MSSEAEAQGQVGGVAGNVAPLENIVNVQVNKPTRKKGEVRLVFDRELSEEVINAIMGGLGYGINWDRRNAHAYIGKWPKAGEAIVTLGSGHTRVIAYDRSKGRKFADDLIGYLKASPKTYKVVENSAQSAGATSH